MPASRKSANAKKPEPPQKGAHLDVIFVGPLLFVPAVTGGNVTGVEIYSPNNGHPVGAVFVPGVWFSDAELNDPECQGWPVAESFSLLDPHSYSFDITQSRSLGVGVAFPVTAIPDTNHKIKPGRKLGSDWEVAISVAGQVSRWSSHRLMDVVDGFYHGGDAPTAKKMAGMHRLTYNGVTRADFRGASSEARDYLHANIAKGGSLIVVGEIPYQASLLHERQAISALAKLAGLDLHLVSIAPTLTRTRVTNHFHPCAYSIIVA